MAGVAGTYLFLTRSYIGTAIRAISQDRQIMPLMGVNPAKLRASLLRELDAFYAQGMFTNGLSTIQTDELHSYEEGINCLAQNLILDYASPRQLERAMVTEPSSSGWRMVSSTVRLNSGSSSRNRTPSSSSRTRRWPRA